jgi:putative N6-adenine-specific DNA methylase
MFRVKNENDLYKRTKEFKWHELLTPSDTIAVHSTVTSEAIHHSKYAALKVKDAIVDKMRNKYGKRPNIDTDKPDYRINLHIYNEDATISLDSSGDSLHKRGYRLAQVDAPLNEVLAAGMLKIAGWNAQNDFYDPMCGSGTLLMEAASIAANIPPGYKRKFGFMNWSDYNEDVWEKLRSEVEIKNPEIKIYGTDNSAKSFVIARKNILNAEFEDYIHLKKDNFFNLKPKGDKGTVIFNPPYDERMKQEEIVEFYKKIGDKLKHDLKGFDAWIISANLNALKHLGFENIAKNNTL